MMRIENDVEKIMESVNRALSSPARLTWELRQNGGGGNPEVYFIYPPGLVSLRRNLEFVAHTWEISTEPEIGSRRKYIGGLVVLVKRLVRALTSWYMNPLVAEIRKFNMGVTRALFDMANNLERIENRIDELEGLIRETKDSCERKGGGCVE